MKPLSASFLYAVVLLGAGCDQLGNPEQLATGPTAWKSAYGELVTTTRSFRDEGTIRRLVSEGMDDLDYADPSIGPSQVLTIVVVAPKALRQLGRREVNLVTTFKLSDGRPMSRRWSGSLRSDKWTAAFALPQPPIGAITAVAP